jgi:two-component system, NtrC family, response regulator AtoC
VNHTEKLNDSFADELSGLPRNVEGRVRWALESRTVAIRILALLNQKHLDMVTIWEILDTLKDFTGLEAIGLRLKEDDDFPCCAFSAAQLADADINPKSQSGNSPDAGAPSAGQCICRDIIFGRADLSLSYFTVGGSFFSNSMSELTDSPSGDHCFANQFGRQGYESVALIPVKSTGEIIGILHFNDERKNLFTSESILFFEAMAAIIGNVLARISVENELRQHNDALEARVQERTLELLSANQLLQKEIQDRMAIESRLIISQQRLELAMRASDLGFWDWNVATGEVFFDARWTEIMGYSLDESEPHYSTWQSLIHADDKPKVLKSLKLCVKGEVPAYEVEYRLRTRSGEWKWILDRGKVVKRDDNRRALRMAGAYLDVTDRKRVEEELYQNEERLRTVFEAARDCLYIKDTLLRYTHANPHFVKILGLPESDILGLTDAALFGKDAAQILREIDTRVLHGETIEQEHTRHIKGIPVTFLDVKVPMRNSRGEIIGIFGISRDMTERKHTQSGPQPIGRYYRSSAMHSALHAARLAADTDIIILLTGESGAGKDHVAKHIHDHSKRGNGPFFSINCAAISPELFESELFGYESGAFTGARGPKRGLLELAEGGTILLNEIGELSLPLQSKLLTFLDSRQFTRVGGVKSLTVNARLVAATNRDLQFEVKKGRFRQDLFYRLNVFCVEVPPLRDRMEDLPLLAEDILQPIATSMGLDVVPSIDRDAMTALEKYHWPGNVRELRNVLERAVILCDKKRITAGDLALHDKMRSRSAEAEWCVSVKFPNKNTLNDVTRDLKKQLVKEALTRTSGRRKRAAELLGITPDALKHYMQTFDLY